uniref:Leucine rich repeats and IQ motif containing 4 n=1 Tax=Crocodylus porosus TaxID=8502 RepID=A0A7M4EQ69_CROPO
MATWHAALYSVHADLSAIVPGLHSANKKLGRGQQGGQKNLHAAQSSLDVHFSKASMESLGDVCLQISRHGQEDGKPEKEAVLPVQVAGRLFFLDLDLEELHLEGNLIESIPGEIHHLKNVKVLYLNKNNIQAICEELGELKCLQSLDLSSNPLSHNSLHVISKLQALRQLRLYDVNLDEFPVQICKCLHHVELLGLSGNQLRCLPKEIVNLRKLREIYLQKNIFESFPIELFHLLNLEIIDLEQNLVSFIPEEVASLINLVKLFLAHNNLSSVPDTLHHCQKLSVLDLSNNLLHRLPPSFKELTEMSELGLSGNSLEKFPRQICHWPSLCLIYLKNTGLQVLPGIQMQALPKCYLTDKCFWQRHVALFT